MAWTLEQIAAAIPQLNDPNQPIVYAMEGTKIFARWDVAHVAFVGLLGGGTIDEEYVLTVDLDPEKSQYDFEEQKHEAETHGGISTDGTISFGGSRSTFKGKQKSFSYRGGLGASVAGGNTPHSYSYTFEDSRVKQPLFALLERAGYARKKGFFGRLFG